MESGRCEERTLTHRQQDRAFSLSSELFSLPPPCQTSATAQSTIDAYPRLDGELVALVNNLYGNALNDMDSSTPSIKFLSHATNKGYLGNGKNVAT